MAEGTVRRVGGEEGGWPAGRGRSRAGKGVEGDEDEEGGATADKERQGGSCSKDHPPTFESNSPSEELIQHDAECIDLHGM